MNHKSLGKGTLVSIKDGYMVVSFDGKEKKFKYPNAIKEGYFMIK